MNIRDFEKRQSGNGSIALSVGVHVIVIALIASITFRYPLAAFFNQKTDIPVEHVQYVRVDQLPRGGNSGNTAKPDKKQARKAAVPETPLLAPTVTPTTLPPIPPATAAPGVIGGTGDGAGGAGAGGIASGMQPALPDPRIGLRPDRLRIPLSVAERNDSAVKAIYMAYRAAEMEAADRPQGPNLRDLTFHKGGGKYGIDSSYIYLGKFKLPSAILAALPIKLGGQDGRRIIEGRTANWIQQDIYTHSQGLSEEDFRAAVRRIRERKDREKKEADQDKAKATPVVP